MTRMFTLDPDIRQFDADRVLCSHINKCQPRRSLQLSRNRFKSSCISEISTPPLPANSLASLSITVELTLDLVRCPRTIRTLSCKTALSINGMENNSGVGLSRIHLSQMTQRTHKLQIERHMGRLLNIRYVLPLFVFHGGVGRG